MLVKNLTRKLLAIALVFTLTFANFAVVTKTYAAGIFESIFADMESTGSKDVEFEAYFKVEDQKLKKLDADVNQKDLKLYFDLNLLDEGYIKNAKISILKADEEKELNFKLAEGFENELVENFENNELRLVKIEEEANNTLELPIEYINEEFISLDKLSGEFNVVFEGIYVDEKAKEIELAKEVTLNLSWKDEKQAKIESEVTKFFQYETNQENYAILQTLVKIDTTTQRNVLPVKDIETKIELPKLEQGEITNIAVVAKATMATNNKANEEVEFDNNNISFDEENKILTIKTENKIQNVELQTEEILKEEEVQEEQKYFSGTGIDEYLVTYKIKNLQIGENNDLTSKISTQITTFSGIGENQTKTEEQIDAVYTLSEQTGKNVSYTLENETENISKGYIYLNINAENKTEIEYKSKSILNISTPELIEELKIEDVENYYLGKDENKVNEEDTYYKSISIAKENFDMILGEEGKIEIQDLEGNVIATIDKNTENVEGYLKANLEQKISKINMKISAPVEEGNLVINQTRGQIETKVDKQTYSQFKSINQAKKLTAKYIEVEEIADIQTVTSETKLDDTTTKANLVLSTESLSTLVENKNVEIKIELNNQKIESDVYGNSVFEIEFPKYVEHLEITNSSIMYGKGLEISNLELLEANERIFIRVSLTGLQEALSSGLLTNGTNIVLNANIKVNQYAPAKQEEIKLYYNNEESTNYKTELVENFKGQLSAVETKTIEYSAPKGIVCVNSISNYNEENSVITSINQGLKKDKLEIYSSSKNAKMELIVMNNSEQNISDISILGRIPFKGVKDVISEESLGTTIDSKLLTTIAQDKNNETGFKVYYSENGGATKDLNYEENGWIENPENLENIKSYLIVPEDSNYIMETNKIIRFSYEYLIPENLEHNTDICSSFATYYSNINGNKEVSGADIVYLTTGEGPQLKIETTTNLEQIKEFEELTITSKVENTAALDAENVVVTIPLPEGTKFVKYQNIDEEEVLVKVEEKNVIFEIEKLEAGKQKELAIVVEVQNLSLEQGKEKIEIEAYSTITAKDFAKTLESEKVKVEILEAEMKIYFAQDTVEYFSKLGEEELILSEEYEFTLKPYIKNLKNIDLNNIEVKINLDSSFEILDVYSWDDSKWDPIKEEVNNVDKENNKIVWNIEKLEAGKGKELAINVRLRKLEDGVTKKIIKNQFSAKADETEKYTSPEAIIILGGAALEIKQTTDNLETYVKEGSDIMYRYEIKNIGTVGAKSVNLVNIVPQGLVVKKIEYTINEKTQTKTINEREKINVTLTIPPGEIANVNITALADSIGQAEELSVTNYATAKGKNTEEVVSNSITHIIEPRIVYDEDGNLVSGNDGSKDNPTIEKTYKITGIAWLDENKDGIRTSDEKRLSGITAKLVNSETGVIKSRTTTNSNGEYTFTNVANGNYIIVFDYDTSLYTVTKYQVTNAATNVNSDVTTTTIVQDGKQTTAGVTNTITIENGSISNIDIGLIQAESFDLKLEKTISKITVQNSKGTETTNYDNKSIAKKEIHSKYINGSTIYVEYSIKVSNVGELAGYAKKIVDYIPDETTFNSSLKGNSDWYTGTDGNLYSSALADTVINPGETKEIKLVLTKQMNENSSSLISNTAEIYETYNVYGAKDINSTAGNKIQNENDMSTADAIIGVRTGEIFIYTSVIITTALLGGIVIFVSYNKLVAKKRKGGV